MEVRSFERKEKGVLNMRLRDTRTRRDRRQALLPTTCEARAGAGRAEGEGILAGYGEAMRNITKKFRGERC